MTETHALPLYCYHRACRCYPVFQTKFVCFDCIHMNSQCGRRHICCYLWITLALFRRLGFPILLSLLSSCSSSTGLVLFRLSSPFVAAWPSDFALLPLDIVTDVYFHFFCENKQRDFLSRHWHTCLNKCVRRS